MKRALNSLLMVFFMVVSVAANVVSNEIKPPLQTTSNYLYVEEITVIRNENHLLRIGLSNTEEIRAVQFDINVPDGFVFDFENFNDRKKGTLYFDVNDLLTNEKSKKFVPPFFLRYLDRKLKPWNGCVPLKIDWLAGKNVIAKNPQTIEKPKENNTFLSDHNPIFVDIIL